MRIVFAGVSKTTAPILTDLGVKNFLSSFETPKLVEEAAQGLVRNYPGTALLCDSGAFSAWTRGIEINLAEYIDFAKDLLARYEGRISHIYIANLDVIPGRQGTVPSRREVEAAAKAGWENMLTMQRAGITPIHIFHQGERYEWLEAMSRRLRYIGISPSNDASTKSKKLWMRKVYSIIRARNMTHGFAVTAKDLMESFPWYSVDSTSWLAPMIYGKATFSRSFEAEGLSSRKKSHVEYVLKQQIKTLLRLQQRYTGLWAGRGVTWDEDEAADLARKP